MKKNYKKFTIKSASEYSANYSFSYEKPIICPHCGISTDFILSSAAILQSDDSLFLVGIYKCTDCAEQTLSISARRLDAPDEAKNIFVYPESNVELFDNDNLRALSERFMDIYNQAEMSEFAGSLELAAIGYRSALEVLIKDFAIRELGKPEDEVIKKNLFDAISCYMPNESLANSADVVRILGNDYTHYKRKYPEHDFALLKNYMEIFLKSIEVQYMIKHPPVSRNLTDDTK